LFIGAFGLKPSGLRPPHKRRILGDFFIIENTPEKIVLGNRACPFAEKVIGRTSMCGERRMSDAPF
jgi:hypothetical protein